MEKSPPVASPETAAAAAEVAARFRSLVDTEDVGAIRQTQHLILGRLQDSNAVLTHFNEYSEQCFAEVSNDFASKTRLLKSMKNDLDHIFLKLRLGRLQDSNAVLTHFNEYSEQCFAEVSNDFASKTRLLKSMKNDLDHIFLKLRSMKSRLAATYPDAFPKGAMAKTLDQRPDLESPLD